MKNSCLMICFGLMLAGTVQAAPAEKELANVEGQIKELNRQLRAIHLAENREEVEGQGLSIDDWEAYSKELEKIRSQNEQERKILDELEKLRLHKIDLMNQQNGHKSH